MTDRVDLINILQLSFTLRNSIKDIVQSTSADPAGSAFSAGLVNYKAEVKLGDIHHTVILIHNNHTAGAHNRAKFFQMLIVDGSVQMVLCNHSAGGSAGLHSLKLFPICNSPSDIVHNLSEGRSHRHFHQTGVS